MFEFLKNKNKWSKYYEEFKSFFNPRFLNDAIIDDQIFKFVKFIIKEKEEEQIFRFIISCSIVNGILIGMPGDAGSLLLVVQAFEFLMALHIARMVGLKFTKENTFKLIGAVGLSTMAVFYGFKKVLDIIFKFVAQLPVAAPASLVSTTITTLFLGMFFYLSFKEIKISGKKKLGIPSILRITKNSSVFTYKIGKSILNLFYKDLPDLLKKTKENVKMFMQAKIDYNKKIKGEVFFAASMVYLLEGKTKSFDGPISEMWLDAWRSSFTNKLNPDASIDEIRNLALSYKTEQMPGVSNLVESKFYEILESTHENMDGDAWSAKLFEDPSHPATDVRFYNSATKQTYEVNYKLTDDVNYIETHLEKYPDKPVITNPEVAEKMNNPLVSGGEYERSEVIKLSDEKFNNLLNSEHDLYLQEAAIIGGVLALSVHLFPFFIAYNKGNISRDQFIKAVKKFVPEITAKTLNRIIMSTLFGPIYGWYILSSIVFKVTSHEKDKTDKVKYLFYKPVVN